MSQVLDELYRYLIYFGPLFETRITRFDQLLIQIYLFLIFHISIFKTTKNLNMKIKPLDMICIIF